MKKLLLCALSLLFLEGKFLATDTLLSIAKTSLTQPSGTKSLEDFVDCTECTVNSDDVTSSLPLCNLSLQKCCWSGACLTQDQVNADNATINSDNALITDAFVDSQIQKMQDLLNQGADPNVMDNKNCTPLRYVVADRKNIEMATILLKAGADKTINNKDSYFNKTVLAYATDDKNQEMIDLLTSYGATN
jgi:ankyrin repeat protein